MSDQEEQRLIAVPPVTMESVLEQRSVVLEIASDEPNLKVRVLMFGGSNQGQVDERDLVFLSNVVDGEPEQHGVCAPWNELRAALDIALNAARNLPYDE